MTWKIWPVPMTAAALARFLTGTELPDVETPDGVRLTVSWLGLTVVVNGALQNGALVKELEGGAICVIWRAVTIAKNEAGRYEVVNPIGRAVVWAWLTDYEGKTEVSVHVDLPYLEPFAQAVLARIEDASIGLVPATGAPEARATPAGAATGVGLPPVTDAIDQFILKLVTAAPDLSDTQVAAKLRYRNKDGLPFSRQAINARRRKLEAMGYTVR